MEQNGLAAELFAGIASGYDRWALVFSLFQYARWHASLLAALAPRPGERVLDLSTGTGSVAFQVAARRCAVVGLDLSREMLHQAVRRNTSRYSEGHASQHSVEFVQGRAEELPFSSASFDAITFTFLLRYVAKPKLPMQEIARVLRPGGRVAMLEFAVPAAPLIRPLWSFYAHIALPLITRPISSGWARVGTFLGKSITDYYRRYPLTRLVSDWQDIGLGNIRCRSLSLGGAVIVTGEKG